jgi:hypothetical protein
MGDKFKGDSGSAFSRYSVGRTRRLFRLACLSGTLVVEEFNGQSVPSEEMLGLEGGSRSVSPAMPGKGCRVPQRGLQDGPLCPAVVDFSRFVCSLLLSRARRLKLNGWRETFARHGKAEGYNLENRR